MGVTGVVMAQSRVVAPLHFTGLRAGPFSASKGNKADIFGLDYPLKPLGALSD
jgi:hypothetical protein